MTLTKLKAHCIIHVAALLHGGTAFYFAAFPFSKTIILSAETCFMILALSKAAGANWTIATAMTFAKQQLANPIGVLATKELPRHIPIARNIINSSFAIVITEYIGWSTYHELISCK